MSNVDWTPFTVTVPFRGKTRSAAIACCSVLLYLDLPVAEIATEVGNAIGRYQKLIGSDALSWYIGSDGDWKKLVPRVLKKNAGILADFPSDYHAFEAHYEADPVPGSFGLAFYGSDLKDSVDVSGTNLLRFDFPANWARDDRLLATFRSFVRETLELLPTQSANAGLCFKRTENSMNSAKKGIHQLLPRYLGFDVYYSLVRLAMRDRTFTAHWLNYVNASMLHRLREQVDVQALLKSCEVTDVAGGLLVQGAKYPPIGDANRQAPDIGCLPDVARALKPLRTTLHAFGTPDFDAQAWLARFDEMPSRAWDNSDVI